jgi:hypothetical protein
MLPGPCPTCGGQSVVDRRVTLMLCALMVFIIFTAVLLYRDKTIKCSMNDSVKNNIQASHFYNDSIYTYNEFNYTLLGVTADEDGKLWGSSMQPTFFEGNTVLLQNYTNNTIIRTGDMVRYFRFSKKYPNCSVIRDKLLENDSLAVIHRINAIYDDEILMQGDNTNTLERIDRCQITQVVVGIIFT